MQKELSGSETSQSIQGEVLNAVTKTSPVKSEVTSGARGGSDSRKGPGAKALRQPLKAGGGKGTDSPLQSPEREDSPGYTFISAWGIPWSTSGLQISEKA